MYLSTESQKITLEAKKYNFKTIFKIKKIIRDYISDYSIINKCSEGIK